MKQKNKTQKSLTDFLGINKVVFSDWKANKNTSYLKHISKIAEYLNVSTDYLLGNGQKENNPPKDELSRLILNEVENCSEAENKAILEQIKIIKSLRNK